MTFLVKKKLSKLTQNEIFNYLKKLYPLSYIQFHESLYKGVYIRLECNHTGQNIGIELNKYGSKCYKIPN